MPSLSSEPTPEYGAPYLPITTATTRRTTVDTTPLEIPTFDRSWHPNQITEWLSEVEEDENVSEDDLTRARLIVREALGIDD